VIDRAGRDLAGRVARLRRRRPGERYPGRLRAQITAWVRARRDRDAWWCDVARDLGLPAETLKRWAAPVPDTATARMVAVEVTDTRSCGYPRRRALGSVCRNEELQRAHSRHGSHRARCDLLTFENE